MRSEAPLVSVIVATRNAQETIEDCVESLLALRYPRERLEIVVVDNGSADETRALLAAFEPTIAVAEESRPGAAAARNAGLRLAGGEIVAFTDADCIVDDQWLAELVWPLDDARVGIAGGPILARQPACAAELYGDAIHDHRAAMLVYVPPYAATGNWASRAALLKELGRFDERLRRSQDTDLAWRIVKAGYRLAFCPEAIVYHRNERTAAGLFREGYQHGFHGVRVSRLHGEFVTRAKREAPKRRRRAAGAGFTRYRLAFLSGRRVGRIAGSVWSRLRPL